MPTGQFTEADILPGKGQFTDADVMVLPSLDSRTRGVAGKPKTPGKTLREQATEMAGGLPFGIGSFLASPVAGAATIGEGISRMGEDKTGSVAGGVSDVIRGGMQAMTPSMPAAVAAMGPLRFAASLGLGVGSAGLTENILKMGGIPDGYAELAGTLAGGYAAVKAPGAIKSGAETALEAIKANGGKINPKVAREVGTGLGAILGGKLGGGAGILGGGYIGRKVGGYVGKALADRIIPGTPEAPAVPAIYDQIAQGLGAKDYASAGEVAQAVIEKLAATASAKPAVTRTPAPATAPTGPVSTGAPPAAGMAKSLGQQIDEEIAARKAQAPLQTAGPQLPVNIPPTAQAATPVSPDASLEDLLGQSLDIIKQGKRATPVIPEAQSPDVQGITDAVRDLPQQTRDAIAASSYRAAKEGQLDPATAAATYQSVARVNKAEDMARLLYDQGVTAGKASKWGLDRWKREGDAIGIPIGSLDTAAEIVLQMGRLKGK